MAEKAGAYGKQEVRFAWAVVQELAAGLTDLWIGWAEPQSICWLKSASERVDGKWDTKVFEERAKEKNKERYERAKEHEEAAKTGKSGLLLPSSSSLLPCSFLVDNLHSRFAPPYREEGPTSERSAETDSSSSGKRGSSEPGGQPQQDTCRKQFDRTRSWAARFLRECSIDPATTACLLVWF